MGFVAGPMIVLYDEDLDAELLEAIEGPPYLRTLLVSSFVSCVGSGVGRDLVLVDWTSSLGEMSSNGDFLKVGIVEGFLQWFETVDDRVSHCDDPYSAGVGP